MNWFTIIWSWVGPYVKKLAKILLQEGMDTLMVLGKEIVKEISTLELSNEEKRKLAFARISDAAKKQGIAYKDRAINIVIEFAVDELKG